MESTIQGFYLLADFSAVGSHGISIFQAGMIVMWLDLGIMRAVVSFFLHTPPDCMNVLCNIFLVEGYSLPKATALLHAAVL